MYRLRRLRTGMSMASDFRRAGGARGVQIRHRSQSRPARAERQFQGESIRADDASECRSGGRKQEEMGARSQRLIVSYAHLICRLKTGAIPMRDAPVSFSKRCKPK